MKEFDLLQHVYAANRELDARIEIPPGDDMGMIRLADGSCILAAVDQVIAGRHFDPRIAPIELIGRKAITRSLSDVAAMAAVPVASLVAVALPPDFGEENAATMFDVMRAAADEFGCPLIGGDIAIHATAQSPLVATTTVFAQPIDAAHPPRLRSAAEVQDGVYVTGSLGGSFQSGRHLTFSPRIHEAIELYRSLGDALHAMIDISDGLGRDASHIAQLSNVRIEIDASLIPCNDRVAWRRAVADGEDYELCFTASAAPPAQIRGVPITRIGSVIPPDQSEKRVILIDENERIDISREGWQHQS